MPDRTALQALIDKHFTGANLINFETLTGGVSAEVTRLDLELDGKAQSVVLRVHGASHDGHDLDTEFAILSALHQAGHAVPKPIACDDSRTLITHPYLLMEFIKGTKEIPEGNIEARIAQMADHMAALHSAHVAGLPELPQMLDPLPLLLDCLDGSQSSEPLRPIVPKLKPSPYSEKPALLHGDFWPGNILWDEAGAIKAVIDWEDAGLGDPLFDIACTCLELRYLYGPRGEEIFRRAIGKYRTIDPRRLSLWQAYAALWAQQNMGHWGLRADKENAMRAEAQNTLAIALETITN